MSRIGNLFRKFRSAEPEKSQTAQSHVGWVVAGLGNPDRDWAGSRHNIGFMVVDSIARTKQARVEKRKFKGFYGELKLADQVAILIKPQTYYNLSGESVAPLLSYFNVPAQRLIVVHDELDLEAGRIMIKRGGGDAGNRGVRSLIEAIGSSDFIRVRVGISHPGEETDTKDYILTPMNAEDAAMLKRSIARAAEAVEAIIIEGLQPAMNRFNQRA